MISNRSSYSDNVHPFQIVHKNNGMGHTRIDTRKNLFHAIDGYRLIEFEAEGFGHLKVYFFSVHPGREDSSQGLKSQRGTCNPFQIGEPGCTTSPVSAHLCLASVRIIEAPLEIRLLGPLDEDETVRTDRDPSLTDFSNEVFQAILFQKGFSMVDEDKVVSAPAHLCKRNLHYASGLKQVQISSAKCQMNDKYLNVKFFLFDIWISDFV
jgi:hypothetical protein